MAVFFEYTENVKFGVESLSTDFTYSFPLSNPSSVIVAQHVLSPGHTGTSEYILVDARFAVEKTDATSGATVGVVIQFKEVTATAWANIASTVGTMPTVSTGAPSYISIAGHSTAAKVMPVMFRVVVTSTAGGGATFKMGTNQYFIPYAAGWIGS